MEKNEGIILLLEVQEALEHFFKNATNYSLINFLNFRVEAYDFTYNKRREHLLYKKSLEILAINDDLARTYLSDFAHEKSSKKVEIFWRSINKKFNNDKIEDIEADYDLTVAAEVSQQMKTYIRSTTARITTRFSERVSPSKRLLQASKNQSQDELYDDDNFLDTRKQSSKKRKNINIEKAKFTMLRNQNIYPLCKPFKEFLKEDAEELFDVISNNTNVEFDLPENIKDYIEHLLNGDIEDAFSKVEKSVDNTDPLLLWTREICRHFLLYYYFGGLQIKGNEKTWSTQTVYRILDLFLIFFGKIISGIAFGENSNEAHNDRKNDAVLYQDKDATVLYEQSYGPNEFELPHQLNDFVKLAQNGVEDLNYHFAQHKNCSITSAKKFKSIGIHGYKYLVSVYLTDIICIRTYRIYEVFCFKIPTSYSERWELLNIARFGVLLEKLLTQRRSVKEEMSKENALKINNDLCIGDWIKIPINRN
ncbi:hypothetical protein F8M41_020216 [Gigaspora margarita]|uniref:Uncharacterized protein n=1 Tax=Gigaspora margarita TaxID=4874 RepID=A0A8H4EK08_GIGMA|nr:hypothetical protein F8M41_020216 [Gigaspora margarita]